MSHTSTGIALLIIALAVIAAACTGSVASNDETTATIPQQLKPGDPMAGAPLYQAVCATCHGADLGGVEGLGVALWPSAFIASRSEDDLTTLIIQGRPADHPDSVTGVAMVPRGGNPSLSDQDIADIVAYIKGQE